MYGEVDAGATVSVPWRDHCDLPTRTCSIAFFRFDTRVVRVSLDLCDRRRLRAHLTHPPRPPRSATPAKLQRPIASANIQGIVSLRSWLVRRHRISLKIGSASCRETAL